MLCSSNGSCHQFQLYTGAEEGRQGGLGESVVESFSKIIPAGCHVFIDNYFTSIKLLRTLAEKLIGCTGTVRRNRLRGGQNILSDEKELKKNPRGTSEVVHASEESINVIQWLDNKCVVLASNTCSDAPSSKCKRFSKKEKKDVEFPQPNAVKLYNRHMGGVDLIDESISGYRCSIRIRKWYFKIITWMLDLACANAWRMYRSNNVDNPSYLAFRRAVVMGLLSENVRLHKPSKLRRTEHVVFRDVAAKRARCRVCQSNTIYRCDSCKVPLHPNCFHTYHQ